MGFKWDDPKLIHQTTRYTDWYKCILGHKDVIQIIDECEATFRHNWQENNKFRTAMCSLEKHGRCPFCDALNKPNKIVTEHRRMGVFATTIIHLTRAPLQGKPRFIGRILAWRFGDDKKNDLMEINEVVGKRIMKISLVLKIKGATSKEERYQELSIHQLTDPQGLPKSMLDSLPDAMKNRIKKEIKEKREMIKRLYLPTPEDLERFIKIDEGAESFNPEEFEAELEEETEEKEAESAPWDTEEEEEEALEEEEEETPPKKGKKLKKPLKKKGNAFPNVEDDLDELMR